MSNKQNSEIDSALQQTGQKHGCTGKVVPKRQKMRFWKKCAIYRYFF